MNKLELTYELKLKVNGMIWQFYLRNIPVLMAMFSLIFILANEFLNQDPGCLTISSVSWYKEDHVTFIYVHLLVKQK